MEHGLGPKYILHAGYKAEVYALHNQDHQEWQGHVKDGLSAPYLAHIMAVAPTSYDF